MKVICALFACAAQANGGTGDWNGVPYPSGMDGIGMDGPSGHEMAVQAHLCLYGLDKKGLCLDDYTKEAEWAYRQGDELYRKAAYRMGNGISKGTGEWAYPQGSVWKGKPTDACGEDFVWSPSNPCEKDCVFPKWARSLDSHPSNAMVAASVFKACCNGGTADYGALPPDFVMDSKPCCTDCLDEFIAEQERIVKSGQCKIPEIEPGTYSSYGQAIFTCRYCNKQAVCATPQPTKAPTLPPCAARTDKHSCEVRRGSRTRSEDSHTFFQIQPHPLGTKIPARFGECEWIVNERYAKADGSMGWVEQNSYWLRGRGAKWRKVISSGGRWQNLATVEAKPKLSSEAYQPLYMCSSLSTHWFKYAGEACSPSDDFNCLRSDFVSVNNGPGPQIRKAVHSFPKKIRGAYLNALFCGKLLRESYCEQRLPNWFEEFNGKGIGDLPSKGGGCFHKDTEFQKRSGQTATPTAVSALQEGDQILMYDMDNATTKYATVLGFAVKPSGYCDELSDTWGRRNKSNLGRYGTASGYPTRVQKETKFRMFSYINITYQINDYQFSGEQVDAVGEFTDDSDPPARHVSTMSGSGSFSVTPAHMLAIVRNGSVLHMKAKDSVLGDMLAIWDGTGLASASITSLSTRDASNEAVADAYLPITDKGLHAVLADGAVVPMDAEIVVDGIKINDIYVRSLISASGQIYANIPAALRGSLVAPLMALEDSELYGPCVQTAAFTNIWLRLLRRDNGTILELVAAAGNHNIVLDLVMGEIISAFFPSWPSPPSFVKGTINSATVLGMNFDGVVRYFDLFRESFDQNEPENKTYYAPTPTPSNAPTPLPSKSPTTPTASPTASPTADPTAAPAAAAGGSTTIIIVLIVIVIIVVLSVFVVCWRKKKEGISVAPESNLISVASSEKQQRN